MKLLYETLRYASGGFMLSVFEYLFTIFLAEVILIHPSAAYAISLALGMILIFKFHQHITFRTDGHMGKFVGVMSVYYIALWAASTWLSFFIPYYYAIIVTLVVMGPIVFLINKYEVFRTKS